MMMSKMTDLLKNTPVLTCHHFFYQLHTYTVNEAIELLVDYKHDYLNVIFFVCVCAILSDFYLSVSLLNDNHMMYCKHKSQNVLYHHPLRNNALILTKNCEQI